MISRNIFCILILLLLMLNSVNAYNLNWDKNGNLISGDGYYRQYNSFNQLSRIFVGDSDNGTLLASFIYSPVDERVLIKKIYNSSGQAIEKTVYLSKNFIRVENETGIFDYTLIYHEDTLVAQRNPDSSKFFFHTDLLGSIVLVTDENGNPLEGTFYTPYGIIDSGGDLSRFDYTGMEKDKRLPEYDYKARMYAADMARFTSPDRVIKNRYNPQDLNHYTYASNNPYRYIDPNGLWTVQVGGSVSGGFGGGGTVGGGIVAGYNARTGPQIGGYTMHGGGLHIGQTGSAQFDITGSLNKHVQDLSGITTTAGGSASIGITGPGYTALGLTVGSEVNKPIDEKKRDKKDKILPSFTFSLGIGAGTVFEGHLYQTFTNVYPWYPEEKSGSGNSVRTTKKGRNVCSTCDDEGYAPGWNPKPKK